MQEKLIKMRELLNCVILGEKENGLEIGQIYPINGPIHLNKN